MTRIFLLALCLPLSACESPPSVAYLTKPADPAAKAPVHFVADATEGTRDYAPAEPGNWEQINRAVTPKESAK